jgi:hypothetical protein
MKFVNIIGGSSRAKSRLTCEGKLGRRGGKRVHVMSSLIAPGFALETVRKQKNGCSCGKEKTAQGAVLQTLADQIT